MARIAARHRLAVPHSRVWAAVSDLASHHRWMRDAERVSFLADRQRGVGTRMEVETVLGPLRTTDVIEITGWVEGEVIEVTHLGLVRGEGALRVRPDGEGTSVEWEETLRFPWWLGGAITALLARPILAAIWRGNLRRLERMLSGP